MTKYLNVSAEEELIIADLDKEIEIWEALNELEKHPAFRKLLQNYLEDKPLELTYSLGTIENNSCNNDNVARQLTSIALFKRYLGDVKTAGENAYAEKQSILDRSK